MSIITKISTLDARFPLTDGAGSDAIHDVNVYSYPVTQLHSDKGFTGIGIALTLGGGNDLLCKLIETLAQPLLNQDIEDVMADFGTLLKKIADSPQYRWLGPHKGMVHLALSLYHQCLF